MILIKLIRHLFLVMQLSMFMTTTVIMMVKPPTFSAAADATNAVTDASKTKQQVVGALRKARLTNAIVNGDDEPSSNNIPTQRDRCPSCDNTLLKIRLGALIHYPGATIGGNCLEKCVFSSTLWAWQLRGWVCGQCPDI
jgi:hypothetical protein